MTKSFPDGYCVNRDTTLMY